MGRAEWHDATDAYKAGYRAGYNGGENLARYSVAPDIYDGAYSNGAMDAIENEESRS